MKKNNRSQMRPGLYEQVYERETQARVSKAEEEALKLEAYERTAANRRNRGIARALIAFILGALIILILTFMVYRFLFVISSVEAQGNNLYTAEELADAAGVFAGDNLYSFSSRAAEEKLKSICPYVKSLSVKRHIPNKIVLTVEEYTPYFFADIYGEIFILAEDLCVLEISDSIPEDLCRLKLPAVSKAVAGQTVEFVSPSVHSQIQTTCCAVVSSELGGRIGAVDFTDPFKLNMECDQKYLLVFGTYDECELRLRVAAAVLKDEMFSSENKARLDLTNASQTTVTIDNTLVFD